ncbi:hypothetical protein MTP03_37840 [Tsukamurella sp. PLM1]|nr:hypothetical protein MTP03_37840 [Tsukamurella sp. PLM1]
MTDTTFRDAHQSLLATRVRTSALATIAPYEARLTPQLLSVEAWGGATYDVALRFLHEDPWERLATLREGLPNVCLQMLLRGRNTVGYTPYPQQVTDAFVAEAAATGVDIFRIFDALNDVEQMRPAIEAVLATGIAVAEGALSYTGDLSNPGERLYTLDYYLGVAEKIVQAGAHVLAIKDMAGLLRPAAATTLVTALRKEFDLPVHVHTHDTPGGQLATYLAAWTAGADAVDGAAAPLRHHQPALAVVDRRRDRAHRARHRHRPRRGLRARALLGGRARAYAPFESGLKAPTGRVYHHEIPGGQLSNLRQQAGALGLAERFEDIENSYAAADRMLGRLVKVTPSSKVVGDLALALVGTGVSPDDFAADPGRYDIPDSVIGFLRGELGTPPGGWPEPLRTRALEGRADAPPISDVPADEAAELAGTSEQRRAALSRLLFPGPMREFTEHRAEFGDVSKLSTNQFLYGLRQGEEHRVQLATGVELLIKLDGVGEPDEHGNRTLVCTLNGQLRTVAVRDNSVQADVPAAERADKSNPGHVAAPFAGMVTPTVHAGSTVEVGDQIATIEAMKMEATITAPVAGTVARVALAGATQVDGGDLVAVIES